MATPIYAPNPVSVLPNVDQVYNAPREPSALEIGTLAALRAGGEVMDALRERRNTIAQLNAAAEAIEGVDPTQAEIYRKMAGSVQAYIPHSGGGPGGAAAGSRAARGVQGDLLSNMIKFAQETSLMRQQQQNALARINAESQARMAVESMRGGLQKQLLELENQYVLGREDTRTVNARLNALLGDDNLPSELRQRIFSAVTKHEDPRAQLTAAQNALSNFDFSRFEQEQWNRQLERTLQTQAIGDSLDIVKQRAIDENQAKLNQQYGRTAGPSFESVPVQVSPGNPELGVDPDYRNYPAVWDPENGEFVIPPIRQAGEQSLTTGGTMAEPQDGLGNLLKRANIIPSPAQR